MLKSILPLIASTVLQYAQAQQANDVLDSFFITRLGNAIQINFGIKGGTSCDGVILERAGDSLQFTAIDVIPGICGGTYRTEFYSFTDRSPFANATNYYRILPGGTGFSDTLSVYFVPVSDKFILYPNPSTDSFHMLFNQVYPRAEVRIYTSNGLLCREWHLSNTDNFLVTPELTNGLYYLQVSTDGGEQQTEKMLIQIAK